MQARLKYNGDISELDPPMRSSRSDLKNYLQLPLGRLGRYFTLTEKYRDDVVDLGQVVGINIDTDHLELEDITKMFTRLIQQTHEDREELEYAEGRIKRQATDQSNMEAKLIAQRLHLNRALMGLLDELNDSELDHIAQETESIAEMQIKQRESMSGNEVDLFGRTLMKAESAVRILIKHVEKLMRQVSEQEHVAALQDQSLEDVVGQRDAVTEERDAVTEERNGLFERIKRLTVHVENVKAIARQEYKRANVAEARAEKEGLRADTAESRTENAEEQLKKEKHRANAAEIIAKEHGQRATTLEQQLVKERKQREEVGMRAFGIDSENDTLRTQLKAAETKLRVSQEKNAIIEDTHKRVIKMEEQSDLESITGLLSNPTRATKRFFDKGTFRLLVRAFAVGAFGAVVSTVTFFLTRSNTEIHNNQPHIQDSRPSSQPSTPKGSSDQNPESRKNVFPRRQLNE